MRQNSVGIGHTRLEPQPIRPLRAVVTLDQPIGGESGNVLHRIDVVYVGPPQVAPSLNDVGLRPQASQVGQGRQNGMNQLASQSAISVRQSAAQYFGQGQDCLPLAISSAGCIQPIALEAQEVVE